MDRARGLRRLGELYRELAELEQGLGLTRGSLPTIQGRPVGLRAYELVAQFGSDLISIHSASGEYLFASPNVRQLFGWEPGDLKGHSAYEFFHQDDIDRIANDHAAHGPDHTGTVRYRYRCSDGSYRWVETKSQSRSTAHGVEQIVAITRDIHDEVLSTERAQQAERELMRAGQMATVGRVAGAVGHELANPLAAALIGLETLLMDRRHLDPQLVTQLDQVRMGLARAATALSELRVLARETRSEAELDLKDCVRDVLGVASTSIKDRVDVSVEPTRIRTDPARFHHLLYHMLTVHLGGLQAGTADRIRLECRAIEGGIRVELRSAATLDRQMMVADIVGALRGEDGRYELPLALAQQLTDELGGSWSTTTSSGLTVTAVELPNRRLTPDERSPET